MLNKSHKILLYVLLGMAVVSIAGIAGTVLFLPAGDKPWSIAFTVPLVFALAQWGARTTVYECPRCGYHFEVTPSVYFLSPHMLNRRYLACPHCGNKGWANTASGQTGP